MQGIRASAWCLLPQRVPNYSGVIGLQALVSARWNRMRIAPSQECAYAPAHDLRHFGSLRQLSRSSESSEKCSEKQLSPWDEVDAQRPLAPDPYDGTYQMPRGAPDARNLSRHQFHQFMQGKPQRFSKELKVTVMGLSLMVFGIGVTWLTAYIMRPDDFEWVDEERRRIQEAKERIQQKLDRANKLKGG